MEVFKFLSAEETISYLNENNSYGYVVFCEPEKVLELNKKVNDNVVLCSTSGEYTYDGFESHVFTGFQYDLQEVEVVEVLYPPIKSLEKLNGAYNKVKDNENALALLLCDGLSGVEESIVTTFFFAKENFKIIGGSAGDYTEFKETLIYIGKKKVHSVALFFNSKKKTQIVKENIYKPTGIKLLVTDADPINRVVKTFNNNNASTEYAKALGITESELSSHFMNNPLGKIGKDNIYIASPMKVNENKSITFYCQMLPNTFVELLEPMDPISMLQNTISEIKFKPKFTLALNCILRSIKFQNEGLWKNFDHELLRFCKNTTGFICYGEQFYKHHFNQTMVLLAME
ncbi:MULTISPECIES: FIST N-terminal domain-containing protein [Clostridium]|uniref:FIST C-terminal domain-containing protein n=1 Tax=Clostridium cibarium TaxID=2762247 RepID=A0ABR8PVB3_9CLOT|nr:MULTISPECIES: FIST N-terminal domain-containing protein [Clostridium]MBD7912111.1 FIST C-terminal domain-containing protein [Clostridium cibarium]